MAAIEAKSFDSPDEVREFTEGKGHADLISIAGRSIGRATFEPGWRWSNNVKPLAGTDSCQTHHLGYVLSGHMRVWADDGTEAEAKAGDVFMIEPGHDAEVVGDETCVTLEFGDAASYARPS
jgi:mannose-6-phosphate isomerase-like protein (cupin superfamily)